jgi:glutathione S-transferase
MTNMKPQKLTLYQFPISHYCEKVRWTLDYKQLEYEVKNLIPGLHVATTKKLSSQTAVPILYTNQSVIHGSSRIISYLDENFPERNLTPEQSHLKD